MTMRIMTLGDDQITTNASPLSYQEYLYRRLVSQNYDVSFVGTVAGPISPLQREGHAFSIPAFAVEDYIPKATPSPWPDVIVWNGGINDILALVTGGASLALSNATMMSRLDALLARIFRVAPTTRVFVSNMILAKDNGAFNFLNPFIAGFNALIPNIVKEYGARASFVDILAGYDTTNMYSDLYRPNAAGAQRIARSMRDYGVPDA